ncbi:MAG: PAS domain S-box-containing protein, partial [Gammaproteobacteria bacterium]
MATQARLNHILVSSRAVLYSFEATGDNNPTFVSDNIRDLFGYEPSDYLDDRNFVPDHIHPEDTSDLKKGFSDLFEEGHLVNEYRFRRKDGSYCWVSDELRVIYDDAGKPVEVVGSWSNIDERKKAETVVAEAQARIDHILSSSSAVLYSFEATGDHAPTFVSENLQEMFGYEPSDYLDDRNFVPDHIHPEDTSDLKKGFSDLFEEGHLVNEYRFRRKDDNYCWVSDELRVIYDDAGKPVEVVGSWSNIDERKKAEAVVAAAQARTDHILSSSSAVLYSFAATGDNSPTFVSENLREVFGYEPSEYLEDRNFVPSRIHPEDSKDLESGFAALFKEGRLVNEYRFRHKDGSYRWVHDELRIIYDEAGKPMEAVGCWSDITARKEAELAATATHARLNHILACSPAVLYSFAATGDNRSTFISDNVRKIFGYEPSEYLEEPKFVPDRIHPDDATRIGVDLSRLFKEGHLVNEYRFRHKDGSYRIVSDEIKVIYDDTGKPLEVVGSWTDISKRKQVKENLVSLLKTTSLFASLDEAALRDIAAEANSVQLMGGTQLIKQGDLADSFYLVMGGRIRTFVTKDDGNECQTSEVGRGELVGETAILTGEPQLESARAIRDTNLLQFSKETFYRLVEHHPETVLLLSKNIAIRYQREVRGITANSVVSTIAVIPAGHGAPVSDFVKCLTASLSEIGPTLHLDVECMASALRQGSADDSEEDRLLKWLHEQEAEFQFVIFESTLEPSSWSKQCIRQADRILSVGTAGGDPALNSIEKEIVSQQDNQTIARQELVLLHPNNNELPSGTGRWLDIRKLDDHHHVILSNPLHHKRLCRILTGN